jgi:hypothetical protein
VGKKKAAADTGDLVKQALLTIATADGPVRLSGKLGHPAVFASAAGANKAAIARLKDGAQPLVAETGSGKTLTVKLTPHGFETIADAVPEEKVGPLARGLAGSLPPQERVAFLQEVVRRTPLATAELLPVLVAAIAEEKEEAEARAAAEAKRRVAEAASLAALERWKAVIAERRQRRVESLRRELAAEGADPDERLTPVEATAGRPKPRGHAVEPNGPEDVGFRRQVARRLVSSWLESIRLNKPEARRFMEVAIGNIEGLEQLADEGERVRFDGTYHRCDTAVSTGTPVTVVRPGWKLAEDGGEYIIEQALVKP